MSENVFDKDNPGTIPQKRINLRSYTISQKDVEKILTRLEEAVKEQGRNTIAHIPRPPEVEVSVWERDKEEHLKNAWQVTTTVAGVDGASIFAPRIENVFSTNTPERISYIFATNRTAFQTTTGRVPPQLFDLNLDFSGPPIMDAENPVSAPTANNSYLFVQGGTESWITRVESAVLEVLKHRRNRRKLFHIAFAYEIALLFCGIPISLSILYYVDSFFSSIFDDMNGVLSGGIFVYLFFLSIFLFRFLFGYVKFLFPTVELTGEHNLPSKHRKWFSWAIGGVVLAGLAKLFWN